jgi:hypothetical protein
MKKREHIGREAMLRAPVERKMKLKGMDPK